MSGAMNWGLLAFLQVDLVTKIFGLMTPAARIVYGIIAVAGILKILSLFVACPGCCKDATGECKK